VPYSLNEFYDDVAEANDAVGDFLGDIYIEPVKDLFEQLIDEVIDLPDIDDINYDRQSGVLLNKYGNTNKIPVVYGERIVGGNVVFLGTRGEINQNLHMVIALCEGEIDSIIDIYIDGVISTDPRFSGFLSFSKYLGSNSQNADGIMLGAYPDLWDETRTLVNTAYISFIFSYDADGKAYSGLPRITALIRGKKVFDPRTGSTVFSQNPILCAYDYLTNNVYGRGLPTSKINLASIISAANECDIQITENNGSASTINQYAINGVINTNDKVLGNFKKILRQCNAYAVYVEGEYNLIIKKDGSSDYSFNEDNILGPIKVFGVSKSSKLNRIRIKYTNKDKAFKGDIVILSSSTFLSNDNGLLLETEVNLPFETSRYRAVYEAERLLKSSRELISASFATTFTAINVKVSDIVDITYSDFGWSSKLFRIMSMDITSDGGIKISLVEHTSSVYDRQVPIEQQPPLNTELPSALSVPGVSGLSIDASESQLFINVDGTIITRALVSWNDPKFIFVNKTEIEYKLDSETVYTQAASVKGSNTTQGFAVNLKDGQNYDFRARHVNFYATSSAWTYTTVYVEGKQAPPPDINSFTVSKQPDGTREFSWTYTPPIDHGGFRIRYVLGTSGSWSTMTPLPGAEELPKGLRLFESNQVLAGTYVFAIKAVDTSGNESVNEKIIVATIGDQRLANAFSIINLRTDGWPGTKTQSEVINGDLVASDQATWQIPATWQFGSWSQNPYLSITYDHTTIDIGGIVTFVPIITASQNGDTLTITESHSDDDITYTSYATAGVSVTARYIKIRVNVTKVSGLIIINTATIVLSGTPVSEVIEDLDTSVLAACVGPPACSSGYRIAAGDFRAPIAENYTKIKRVFVIFQGTSGGWTYDVTDKDTTVGPRIKTYNSSGVLADAPLIDIDITGI